MVMRHLFYISMLIVPILIFNILRKPAGSVKNNAPIISRQGSDDYQIAVKKDKKLIPQEIKSKVTPIVSVNIVAIKSQNDAINNEVKIVLTKQMIRISGETGLSMALIKTIELQESNGNGFYKGKPKMLFERHVFYRNAKECGMEYEEIAMMLDQPEDIISPLAFKSGGSGTDYYGNYSNQTRRFAKAYNICRDAAIMSISIGKYQVLGENYKKCGYATPSEFLKANQTEEGQADCFIQFIVNTRGLVSALNNRDWAKVKKLYNGVKKSDLDGNGIDDYTERLERNHRKALAIMQEKKPIVDSRTMRSTGIDVAGKLAVAASLLPSKPAGQFPVTAPEEVTTIISIVDSLTPFLGESIGSVLMITAIAVAWIAPNMMVVYAYLEDHGYLGK